MRREGRRKRNGKKNGKKNRRINIQIYRFRCLESESFEYIYNVSNEVEWLFDLSIEVTIFFCPDHEQSSIWIEFQIFQMLNFFRNRFDRWIWLLTEGLDFNYSLFNCCLCAIKINLCLVNVVHFCGIFKRLYGDSMRIEIAKQNHRWLS